MALLEQARIFCMVIKEDRSSWGTSSVPQLQREDVLIWTKLPESYVTEARRASALWAKLMIVKKKKKVPSLAFSINEALGDLDRQLESPFKSIKNISLPGTAAVLVGTLYSAFLWAAGILTVPWCIISLQWKSQAITREVVKLQGSQSTPSMLEIRSPTSLSWLFCW